MTVTSIQADIPATATQGHRAERGGGPGAWRTAVARRVVWVIAFAGVAAGCSENEGRISQMVHDYEATVSASEYRVVPPDVIQISAAQASEIDGEMQTVRQDGKISLRLLGDVKVAGMTPVEISRKLETLLKTYYVDPKVSVTVDDSPSKKYYVFGQVNAPGPFRYTGRNTVLSALAQAGPNRIAWTAQVKVIRPSHDEAQRIAMTIDCDRILEHGRLDQNFLLQEGDIVYVPPTVLGWIGLRFQELLFPVQPATQTIQSPTQTVRSLENEN